MFVPACCDTNEGSLCSFLFSLCSLIFADQLPGSSMHILTSQHTIAQVLRIGAALGKGDHLGVKTLGPNAGNYYCSRSVMWSHAKWKAT